LKVAIYQLPSYYNRSYQVQKETAGILIIPAVHAIFGKYRIEF
jgi:hypothetical protein